MADDLDDLLDQIESKLTTKKRLTRKNSFSSDEDAKVEERPKSTFPKPPPRDLADALEDIFNDGPTRERLKAGSRSSNEPKRASTQKSSEGSSSGPAKCFPLLIGGSAESMGLSTSASSRCCSDLRCHNCDFKIEAFDDFRWASETDYLFLRNNMPDFSKLQSRLIAKKQSRAYACQCQWTSVVEACELTADLKRLWHCGGRH